MYKYVPVLGGFLLTQLHVCPGHSNCSPFLALPLRTLVLSTSESAKIGYVHSINPPQKMSHNFRKLIEHPTNTGSSISGIKS